MNNPVILPPSNIGILGGGQLGRMIALKAREMGYFITTLDPTPNSPCGQIADKQVIAEFHSLAGAAELARDCAVITYEFENISKDVARFLELHSYLPQGWNILESSQNRILEKQLIAKAGANIVEYYKVDNLNDFKKGLDEVGYPAVLKTVTGGYDGKGQYVLYDDKCARAVEEQIDKSSKGFILERYIPFLKELSIVVARNPNGEVMAFPVAENIHRDNILFMTIAPARVSKEITATAEKIGIQLANCLKINGLLAVEMFLLSSGEILVNEIAPRPHNSAHFTQQACITSQFEQHIRAICNLPLADTRIICPTVMVNILGEDLKHVLNKLPVLNSSFKIHLYGKKEVKSKRKMGHLNVVGHSVSDALSLINEIGIWSLDDIAKGKASSNS